MLHLLVCFIDIECIILLIYIAHIMYPVYVCVCLYMFCCGICEAEMDSLMAENDVNAAAEALAADAGFQPQQTHSVMMMSQLMQPPLMIWLVLLMIPEL